jgi:hypothetical protein
MPTATGIYRTPLGRLCRLSTRKKDDGNAYHFTYVGRDPSGLPTDGVGRARAYTGEDATGDMGVFALSPANVGILRHAGELKA